MMLIYFSTFVLECHSLQTQKNIFRQLADLLSHNVSSVNKSKEQAVRTYLTKSDLDKANELALQQCKCVPIFRLTRIKHPQDFSDTFLLEVSIFDLTGLIV